MDRRDAGLPDPDSEEIRQLFPSPAVRVAYRVLYDHLQDGVTMAQLRREAAPLLKDLGLTVRPEQLDRRKREIHDHFEVELVRRGREVRHRLVGRRGAPRETRVGISQKTRAIVLSPGRCHMCGRSPSGDGVKLVVDHRIPLEWGGTNKVENLQPLCEECNAGKKDHFASFMRDADKIRRAITHREPHRRIGELLKAFDGKPVRSDLIEVVAHAHQHQEDWQKRLRELRVLGWKIEVSTRKEGRRVWAYYRLAYWEPWPEGPIRAEISRREKAGKKSRRAT